ncbi:MAG TPA: hypothetical protein PLS53_16560 [Thermoanaerobaculaceae bacterium]|nr:hypothetical protein [Thermoanaerobaculaceae bacterium]
MTDWTALTGEALQWQPEGHWNWELRARGNGVARVTWRSTCGSLALASCRHGEWTLKRMGFFRPYITVRTAGSEGDLARMQRAGRVTSLRFGDGSAFTWARLRSRGKDRMFADQAGRPIVSFSPSTRGGPLSGLMTIGSTDVPAGTLVLLAVVGWYRLVLEQMDEEAAMLAATMAAVSAAVS